MPGCMRYGHRTLCGRHRQRVVVVASRPRVGGRPTAPLLTYAASSSSPAVARAVPLCSYCSLRLSLRRTHAHMRMHTCTCTYKWTWTWMVTAAGRAGSCGARPWPVLYRVCGLGLFVHAYDAYALRQSSCHVGRCGSAGCHGSAASMLHALSTFWFLCIIDDRAFRSMFMHTTTLQQRTVRA